MTPREQVALMRAIWPLIRPLFKDDSLPEDFNDVPVGVRDEVTRLFAESAASESDIARLREENAALRAQNAYLAPRQRAGQLVANAMWTLDPMFYDAHRGTEIDPFNHDDRVAEYLRAWKSKIAEGA